MDRLRVMPVLAGAVVAVSLTACQGMMGGKESGQQQTSQANPPATSAPSSGQQAMSSDLVRDVQRGLASRGYDTGPQDGVYGTSTENALRRFQRDQRLSASGQVDAQTLAALGIPSNTLATASRGGGSGSYVPTSKRQGASAAPSGSASRIGLSQTQVRDVQQNLASRGFDPGKVDGRWGPRTQQALRDFQQDQNLQANGRPTPQTLAALGVESGSPSTQTGQLPPEPPAPAEPPQRGLSAPETPPSSDIRREPLSPPGSPAPMPQSNPPD